MIATKWLDVSVSSQVTDWLWRQPLKWTEYIVGTQLNTSDLLMCNVIQNT